MRGQEVPAIKPIYKNIIFHSNQNPNHVNIELAFLCKIYAYNGSVETHLILHRQPFSVCKPLQSTQKTDPIRCPFAGSPANPPACQAARQPARRPVRKVAPGPARVPLPPPVRYAQIAIILWRKLRRRDQ